jgi:hypothetical protein
MVPGVLSDMGIGLEVIFARCFAAADADGTGNEGRPHEDEGDPEASVKRGA